MRGLTRFLGERRGGVSVMLTLMLIPMVAVLGMATEASSWFFTQRAMQNAADSASMAAAWNDCRATETCNNTSPTYDREAVSVATQFGFTNGTANTTVATAIADDDAACATDRCYRVTISRSIPIYMVRLVGFAGNSTADGIAAQSVSSTAVAQVPAPTTYGACVTGLSTATTGNGSIQFSGLPKAAMKGCDILSNGKINCTSSDMTENKIYYAGSQQGCTPNKGGGQVSVVADPFASLNNNPPIPITGGTIINNGKLTSWSGGTLISNGDLQLTGPIGTPIDVTTPNSVMVIKNGQLQTNGRTIKTSGAGSLTIIFSGSTGPSSNKGILLDDAGTIDIKAPNSGPLSGVALMEDSRMSGTGNKIALNLSGSKPTFKVQGLIYVPKGEVSISGAIDKATGGLLCVAIVAYDVKISGGGYILTNPADQTAGATSQCAAAGLSPPPIPGAVVRHALVQ